MKIEFEKDLFTIFNTLIITDGERYIKIPIRRKMGTYIYTLPKYFDEIYKKEYEQIQKLAKDLSEYYEYRIGGAEFIFMVANDSD